MGTMMEMVQSNIQKNYPSNRSSLRRGLKLRNLVVYRNNYLLKAKLLKMRIGKTDFLNVRGMPRWSILYQLMLHKMLRRKWEKNLSVLYLQPQNFEDRLTIKEIWINIVSMTWSKSRSKPIHLSRMPLHKAKAYNETPTNCLVMQSLKKPNK